MATESNWAPAITVQLKTAAPPVKDFSIIAPAVVTGSQAPRIPFIVENQGPHSVVVTIGNVLTTLADVGAAGYFVSNGNATVSLAQGATGAKLRITLGSPWST